MTDSTNERSNRPGHPGHSGQAFPSASAKPPAGEETPATNAIQIPEISLPKGGGALQGIGEKFEVNAANGTAQFSIPVPLTPGRNSFSPSLSLSYNSGAGSGPFGLGWSLDLPVIQRRTDKRLPRYLGGPDEDVFMLSGYEDLVPFLEQEDGEWKEKEHAGAGGCTVKRYRPRTEGAFARIEKITHPGRGVYWKVTTRDNIATVFGRSAGARIANPEDETQIFRWMPECSYDSKGNWIVYGYKKEDLAGVPGDLCEKNRISGLAPQANAYLKRVKYGNRNAAFADPDEPYNPVPPEGEYFFELVLDYGEHGSLLPAPQEDGEWPCRPDAFSSYRAGFEMRTSRLCRRLLMFHHFKDEKQFAGTGEEEDFGENYLVRSLDLEYEYASVSESGQAEVTYLKSAAKSGYVRKPGGAYSKKTLPPAEFSYEKLSWNKTAKSVSPENTLNAPAGLTNNYQWVDLYGEGISGILSEQGEGLYYKSNLGGADGGEAAFSEARKVAPAPSFSGLSAQDLAASGETQLVSAGAPEGYFELADGGWSPFRPFERLANIDLRDPNTRLIDLDGDGRPDIAVTEENVFVWYASDGKNGHRPSERACKPFDEERGPAIVFADREQSVFLADMSGDGLTDIVRIRNGEICYWANKGYGKFSAKVSMSGAPLFDSPDLFSPRYLHLADISGTGTADIVYLGRNRFRAYLNLSGNGWSGAREIEPFFPASGRSRLSVVDLLGTGTSCVVWSSDLPAHADAPMRYIDLMGGKKPHLLTGVKNNFGKEISIHYKSSAHFYLKDKLEGKPWATRLPFPVQTVSKLTVEEMTARVRFTSEYRYRHGYYDRTEREFRGFGMVEQTDSEHYSEWSSPQAGRTEELYQKPVLTRTWFRTGAFLDREKIMTGFEDEYWHREYNRRFPDAPLGVSEPELPGFRFESGDAPDADECREAARACRGMMIRRETFALDAPEDSPAEEALRLEMKPYRVEARSCAVRRLQPRGRNEAAVFLAFEDETLSMEYERDETDCRLAHTLHTEIDNVGNVLESASVVYGRKQSKADAAFQALSDSVTDFAEDAPEGGEAQLQDAFAENIQSAKDEQTKTRIVFTRSGFARHSGGSADADLPRAYRLRLPHETEVYELTGFAPAGDLFAREELKGALGEAQEIAYHEAPGGGKQRRLTEHIKFKYLDDSLNALDFGFFDTLGLSYENYRLAYTTELAKDIFQKEDGTELQAGGENASGLIEEKGRLVSIGGGLWIRSGLIRFKDEGEADAGGARSRFFSPVAYENPFGSVTSVTYDTETFAGADRNSDGYYLYIKSVADAADNKVQIGRFNYRTMSPARIIDLNANPASVLTDELGLVKALAAEGNGVFADETRTETNIAEAADSLEGLKEYADAAEEAALAQLFGAADALGTDTAQLRQAGSSLLGKASVRFAYDFGTFQSGGSRPAAAVSVSREEHYSDNAQSGVLFGFEYSGGLGNVVMSKAQAEPGMAFYTENGQRKEKDTGAELRWTGSGRTVLNNKGNPVKQYEPYFSTNFLYEDASELAESGVTPVLHYDPLGRLAKTEFPDGSLSRTEFGPWKRVSFDRNDTVLESAWHSLRAGGGYAEQGKDPAKEQRAAQKAAAHAGTPSSFYADSMGRPVLGVVCNGKDAADKDRLYTTFTALDIEGNVREIRDARGNSPAVYKYDMLGRRAGQNSMDAGRRWELSDPAGNPVLRWDGRDHVFSFEYDALQRPASARVRGGDGGAALDCVYERTVYGENRPDEYSANLRGKVFRQYDTAGKTEFPRWDFKGNALESVREFCADYKNAPDWTEENLGDASLFDEDLPAYTRRMAYDALSRTVSTVSPDGSETRPAFGEAGLLKQVRVAGPGADEKLFVRDISYNARGQRERIVYADKNENSLASADYSYDAETFRLLRLKTEKAGGGLLQELHYTYDPAGNISETEDKAAPAVFFNNFKAEPRGIYTYDALYRLTQAEGREHAGQALDFGQCDNWQDLPFLKNYSPGDAMAWRKYIQRYAYDPAGNMLEMRHAANGGSWTRTCAYEAGSNRLSETQAGGQNYAYAHHPRHGFITSLPHLSVMEWNFRDELRATARQEVCGGGAGPETVYYVYGAAGERVRKVTETGGAKKEERLYLGETEIYKKHSGSHSGLERATLHVSDGSRRIAMIDTRSGADDGTEERTVRFQLADHLGSACLELSDAGEIISSEEFHPFGTTASQAVNKDIKTAAKRYRYTGKERDSESGLEYHSARYYLPWLARWLKPDPAGLRDGVNVFVFGQNNPVKFKDPTGTENVVVVGAQYEETRANKMMFVHQGIRQIREYGANEGEESRSFVLFTEGYTEAQINRIREVVEGEGAAFITVDSAQELIDYINTGLAPEMVGPGARHMDKISNLDIFSHGLVGSIDFGYGLDSDVASRYRLDSSNVGDIDRNAFGDDGDDLPNRIASYACRTALGDDSDTLDFFGPNIEGSFAAELANQTGVQVRAYIKRTDYSGTLGTWVDRNWHCGSAIFGEQCYTSALTDSLARREDIDGADFDPQGAIHPVKAGDTPYFLFTLSSWRVDVDPEE